MRRTRAALERDLNRLKAIFHTSPERTIKGAIDSMATKRTTSQKSSSRSARSSNGQGKAASAKSPAKQGETRKTKSASASKSSRSSKKSAGESLVAKTSEVLGEVLTGAAIGALTGAAQKVSDQPTAVKPPAGSKVDSGVKKSLAAKSRSSGAKSRASKNSDVLGEIVSGAAVGAVIGAAKAVVPAKGAGKSSPAKRSTKPAARKNG